MTTEATTNPVEPQQDPYGGRWNTLLGEVVGALDTGAQRIAQVLSRFTRVSGAGVFVNWTHPPFVDAWKERYADGSGAFTVMLGRVEYIVDYRAPKRPARGV